MSEVMDEVMDEDNEIQHNIKYNTELIEASDTIEAIADVDGIENTETLDTLNEKERVRQWLYKEQEFDYKSKDFYINCRLIVRYIIQKEFKREQKALIQKEIYNSLMDKLYYLGVPKDFLWDKEDWCARVVKEEIINNTPLYDKNYIEVPEIIVYEIIGLKTAPLRKSLFGIVAHVLYRISKTENEHATWLNINPIKSDIIRKSNLQNLSKRKYYDTLHLLYEMGYIDVATKINGDAIKLTDKIFQQCNKIYAQQIANIKELKELKELKETQEVLISEDRKKEIKDLENKVENRIPSYRIYSLDNLGKEIEKIRKEFRNASKEK